MDVKIRVCLPRKYGRFMLFIDNNLLLPGARLHILNNIFFHALTLSPEDRITSIKHCSPRISSKMATIDEFVLKNIGL
jgi:hypothetical protein